MYPGTFKGNVNIAYSVPPVRIGEYVISRSFDGDQLYRLCYTEEDLLFGEVVREAPLMFDDQNVTTGSAVDTNLLIDSDAFTEAEALLVGAQGLTTKLHADGGGQAFHVVRKLDDSTLEVKVWASQTSAGVGTLNNSVGGGWVYALNSTTPSSYDLWKHGRIEDSTIGIQAMGVCQVNGGVDQSDKPYFFAKMSGTAFTLCDDGTSAILPGQPVFTAANNGHVEGPGTTLQIQVAEQPGLVGICRHNDIGFTGDQDQCIVVDLRLPVISTVSGQFPRFTHPLNAGTI